MFHAAAGEVDERTAQRESSGERKGGSVRREYVKKRGKKGGKKSEKNENK